MNKKSLFLALLFTSPLAWANTYQLDNVQLLSSSQLAGKKAAVFYLGGSSENYCTITATNDYITTASGKLKNSRHDQPEFDASCDWAGKYYVISSKHKTHAEFTISKSVDNTSVLSFNATLTTTKGELATFVGNDIAAIATSNP